MSGSWDVLDRELRRMLLLAAAEHHEVTSADCRAVVARWIGIPEPRLSSEQHQRAETAT